MSDDLVKRLREATFTKGKMRGGAGGQTIEASMRSTFHEVSAWDLEKAADEIEALRARAEAAEGLARLLESPIRADDGVYDYGCDAVDAAISAYRTAIKRSDHD